MRGHAANRPRGALRHYAGLLGPNAAAVAPAMLERDVGARLLRLRSAGAQRARQRLRPSRPRMRALQAAPGGKLHFRDVPAPPPPGPDGAIVHPIAIATCDIDCPMAMGMLQMPLPLHLGHECVAEVVAVGERVQGARPGDRVVVPYEISCGACPQCRAGLTASCASVPPVSAFGMGLATGHWGGAYSDLLRVPYADAMLVPLPEGIDPAAAASVADNLCDAYRHIAPHLPAMLERDPHAEVLVLAAQRRNAPFGASLPLYCGLIAKALGARDVCLVDARARVREHAQRLGIKAIEPRALRRRPRAPLVVDTSVMHLGRALAATAPDGVCTSSGSLHRAAKVPIAAAYVRKATLHVGRTSARPLMPAVLELMRSGALTPELVISTQAPLDQAPWVLGEHFRAGGIKAVLTA
jgi:alcohol dehydrogenase